MGSQAASAANITQQVDSYLNQLNHHDKQVQWTALETLKTLTSHLDKRQHKKQREQLFNRWITQRFDRDETMRTSACEILHGLIPILNKEQRNLFFMGCTRQLIEDQHDSVRAMGV